MDQRKPAMRRVLQISLPLIILGGGFYGAHWLLTNRNKVAPEPTQQFRPIVEVVSVKSETFKPKIISQGKAEPSRMMNFHPEISGKISSLLLGLVSGALISEGQILYQIDDQDYRLALIRSESEIATAKAAITNAFAQIASSEAKLAQADAVLLREQAESVASRKEWELLGNIGEPPDLVIRKPQLQEAKAALKSARAMLDSAVIGSNSGKASLSAAKAAKDQALLNISRCSVTAPFDCRVDAVYVDVGSYVTPSTQTLVLQRTDFCEIKVPLSIEEFEFLGIQDSHASEASLRALGEVVLTSGRNRWDGYLSRIKGDVDSLTQTIGVVVRVNEPYKKNQVPLRFGLHVQVGIQGVDIKNIVKLPEIALRQGRHVYIYSQGKLRSKKVELIRREQGYVYVRGLEDGVQVCVTQLDSFTENMPVVLAERK